jgi:hypothetical protein
MNSLLTKIHRPRLRRQLSEVDLPGLGRRMLTAAIHMPRSAAWRQLPEADRTLLRDKHFRLINSLASPMIPGNATAVLSLFDSGQLDRLN